MNTRAMLALAPALLATAAHAGINFDESVDGDLSNDRANPTSFLLGSGTNTFTFDVVDSDQPEGDIDYFTVILGAGYSLESVILVSSFNPNDGFDSTGFIALQIGNQVTVDPAAPNPAPLAGYVIGDETLIGTNILPDLSGASGPTLGEGAYSLWVQQGGADLTRITLRFNVVPAPGALAGFGALGLLAARRRR